MGFFDSFGSGLASFGRGVLDVGRSFASSPLGSQFLGDVGRFGISKLSSAIGLEPSRGASRPGPEFGRLTSGGFRVPSSSLPRELTDAPAFDRRTLELQLRPGGVLNPVREGRTPIFRPTFSSVPGPVATPATAPFGVMPGTEMVPLPPGGFRMAGFPTTRDASFPGSPITSALFAGGDPGFERAFSPLALGGALARQLPGIVGGFGLGAAVGGGDGGGGTPAFRPTMAGARAQFFRMPNPATGQDTWFRPAGRPLLWSGDLTACRRVNKVARRASRKR